MHLVYKNNMRNLQEAAGKDIGEAVETALQDGAVFLLLSGGPCLSLLSFIPEYVLSDELTVGVLDEKFTDNPSENNFMQLKKTHFFKLAMKAGVEFLDTGVLESETIKDLVERFERTLKMWKVANPDGKIIVTMGIGEDGRTAGIVPFPEDKKNFDDFFEDDNHWVVGYDAEDKGYNLPRVTVNNTFLREEVEEAIVYLPDHNKKIFLIRSLAANIP